MMTRDEMKEIFNRVGLNSNAVDMPSDSRGGLGEVLLRMLNRIEELENAEKFDWFGLEISKMTDEKLIEKSGEITREIEATNNELMAKTELLSKKMDKIRDEAKIRGLI